MESVDRLLRENLLEGEAARVFEEDRARLRQRHANWRANFPAVGALLDTDEERAQALAGNWATEAREIVGAWLAAQDEEGRSAAGDEQRAAWVKDFWRAWRAQVFARGDIAALEGAPRDRFTRIFDELMDRFRDEAASYARDEVGIDAGETLAERLMAPVRGVKRAVAGFFFPSLRR